MYVVLVQPNEGPVTVVGPFDSASEATAYAEFWEEHGDLSELTPALVGVPLGRVPHPSIVTEAKRQAKANACDSPDFTTGHGTRCRNCGTSYLRHPGFWGSQAPKVGLD
jgi:hypothetical protein